MSNEPIPFLDLVTPHRELEEELIGVFRQALRSAAFIGGEQVEGFEREFAAYCGAKYCVGVANGTDAVRFALMASGVGRGDAVVTVTHTFIATVEAISQAGAETEFVDIDPRTYCMSASALETYLAACEKDAKTGRPIGTRTGKAIKAIVPVHLYGQVADMDALIGIASRYDLMVIEDACQAQGAEYRSTDGTWRRAGTFGKAAAFSFYPGKNLGGCGEAGAVTTNDEHVAKTIKMLREHGQSQKYYHDLEGYNGRLDAIQAAFLRVKLRRLDDWNAQRRAAASRYTELLSSLPTVTLPFEPDGSRAVYHLYVIRHGDRDGLAQHLKSRGINTGLHYPLPLHLQKCYREWGYEAGSFPVTERVASEILSLPMFPGLTVDQQQRVIDATKEFVGMPSAGTGRTSRIFGKRLRANEGDMKASTGRVVMLVENEFPRDTRVRNEAFTLAAAGLHVSVIALRGKGEKAREVLDGVSVYRVPRLTVFKKLPQQKRSPLGAVVNRVRILVGYVSEYLYFTTACLFVSCRIALREGIDVIHAHNPPDTLFFVGAFHKLFGRKFVFDHHDLCPELYRSRYTTPNGLLTRGLAFCERASVAVADVVIATNESYRAIDIERNGIAPDRVFIVRNGPDLSRVRLTEPDPELRGRAKVILGYLGAMNPQDGVDYLLRALDRLRHGLNRSDFHCIIIGDGDSLDELKQLAKELRIDDCVTFTGFIPDKDMVRYLSTVDICLDPNPSSPLNDVSTWIKVMEYMALGKPVVSFDLKETRVSAGEAAAYVEPNNETEFAKTIAALMDDATRRARMAEVGRARVQHELGWHVTSRNLLRAYEHLLQKPLVPVAEVRQFSGGTSS